MKSQAEAALTGSSPEDCEFPAREKRSSAPKTSSVGGTADPARPSPARLGSPWESVGQEETPGQASLAVPRPEPAEEDGFSRPNRERRFQSQQTKKRVSWPGEEVKPGPCAEKSPQPARPRPRVSARPQARPASASGPESSPLAGEAPGMCGSALAPGAPSAASENAPCWAKEGGRLPSSKERLGPQLCPSGWGGGGGGCPG